MFEGLWRKCRTCEVLEQWNRELKEQNSNLRIQIANLQDEIFRRDSRLADDKSKLEDALLGRKNGPQQPPRQIQFQPIRKHVDWKTERAKLEEDSRQKKERFQKMMNEAEAKGTLPKRPEDLNGS